MARTTEAHPDPNTNVTRSVGFAVTRLPDRADLVGGAIAVLVFAGSWWGRLDGPIDLRWDAAAYYVLGTSLSEGSGYRFLSEPGHVDAVAWPPLLSAIVAAHQYALQTTDALAVGAVLRRSFLIAWLAYGVLTFVFLRMFFATALAVAGAALVGMNMTAIWLSDRLYADIPLALTITAFVIVVMRRPRSELAAWVLGCAACFLRTAGIVVFVAWIADAMFARHWRLVVQRSILGALPVLAWQGYIAYVENTAAYQHPAYAYARADYMLYNVTYVRNMMMRDPSRPQLGRATLAALPRRMATNSTTAMLRLGETISLLERDFARTVDAAKRQRLGRYVPWRVVPLLLTFFGALVIVGAFGFWFASFRLIPLVIVAYLLLLSILPTDYHWPRYLAAIGPLMAASFLAGVMLLMRWSARVLRSHRAARTATVALVAAAALLQAINLRWYFSHDLRGVSHSFRGTTVEYQAFTYDAAFESFDRAVDTMRFHARADDVVMASMPHWVYLRTGLKSVMPPFEADVNVAAGLMKSAGARFLVVDRSGLSPTFLYASPVVEWDRSWTLLWRDGDSGARVYERRDR